MPNHIATSRPFLKEHLQCDHIPGNDPNGRRNSVTSHRCYICHSTREIELSDGLRVAGCIGFSSPAEDMTDILIWLQSATVISAHSGVRRGSSPSPMEEAFRSHSNTLCLSSGCRLIHLFDSLQLSSSHVSPCYWSSIAAASVRSQRSSRVSLG